MTSSRSLPGSYESSVSSDHDESSSSRSITSELYSPSPSVIPTPSLSRTTPTSPDKIKGQRNNSF